MCQVNLDVHFQVIIMHVIYIKLLFDMPFQMKNSFVKATNRHLSIFMGLICCGPSLLWVKIVLGRNGPSCPRTPFMTTEVLR